MDPGGQTLPAATAPAADVAAIVVTFHPDMEALAGLLDAINPQVASVILIDNGSSTELRTWLKRMHPDIHPIFPDENQGLAAAHNLGIEHARRLGVEYVLLLDQDSSPAPDMVEHLHIAISEKRTAGERVAAVGPRYFDKFQGALRPFVQVRGLRVRRFDCDRPKQVLEVDHLISSGSLISMDALDEIGGMAEPLFIDYVDTEWCLRAWKKGYRLYGVCNARMLHHLGKSPNYFLGRYIPVHDPLRHYYLTRNAVWLYRQDWIPLGWKLATSRRLILKFFYFTLFGPERCMQAWRMLRGLIDGLKNRMGRFEA